MTSSMWSKPVEHVRARAARRRGSRRPRPSDGDDEQQDDLAGLVEIGANDEASMRSASW